jgi:hypothetical protein
MVNSRVKSTPYQATPAARSSILPTHSAPLGMVAYRQEQCQVAARFEFNGPIRRHPRQIIGKHIPIFMDHRYHIQTLGDNSVNRCMETSNRWQLQRNLTQNSLMPLHLVHTKNDIYSLTFQVDETGWKHSPNELQWNYTNHTIGNHVTSGSGNGIRCRVSPKSKLILLSIG